MIDYPLGIDVAFYQEEPDWAVVRASGVHFAFIRASQGDDIETTQLLHGVLENEPPLARSLHTRAERVECGLIIRGLLVLAREVHRGAGIRECAPA